MVTELCFSETYSKALLRRLVLSLLFKSMNMVEIYCDNFLNGIAKNEEVFVTKISLRKKEYERKKAMSTLF